METYVISWGPTEREDKILVLLLDPYRTPINSAWLPKNTTKEEAEQYFLDEGSLPENEVGHVSHEGLD